MSNRVLHAEHEMHGHFARALADYGDSRKWMTRRNLTWKAANESAGNAGGAMVPDTFSSAIIRSVDDYSAFQANADVINTVSDVVNRPRANGRVTANWVAESGVIPSSDATLDDVSLTLRKIAVLVKSSTEAWDDAVGLGEWLVDESALAFSSTIDACGFSGDGTSTYRGMSGLAHVLTGASAVDAASGHSAFSSIDASDFGNLIGSIQGAAIRDAAFYVSPQAFGQIMCRLSVSMGGLAVDAAGRPVFLGFPCVLSPDAPISGSAGAPLIYFGSLKRACVMAQRHAMTAQAGLEAGLDKDQVWFRCTWRVALAIHAPTGQMSMLVGKS